MRDVLELIVDRFDVTVANSKIDPLPPQADTEERIVVGAHCDTAGMQPGADNNTSGVAGLIELASLLREASLPLCVELVAFTLEEEPHLLSAPMGSAVHAASLRQQHIPVRVIFR